MFTEPSVCNCVCGATKWLDITEIYMFSYLKLKRITKNFFVDLSKSFGFIFWLEDNLAVITLSAS